MHFVGIDVNGDSFMRELELSQDVVPVGLVFEDGPAEEVLVGDGSSSEVVKIDIFLGCN